MIREHERIFPDWHTDPMSRTDCKDWFDDASTICPTVYDMEQAIEDETCPYRREAKALHVLHYIESRVGGNFANMYADLRRIISQAQEQQTAIEHEREERQAWAEQHVADERKRLTALYTAKMEKELKLLYEDCLSGKVGTPPSPLKEGDTVAGRHRQDTPENTPPEALRSTPDNTPPEAPRSGTPGTPGKTGKAQRSGKPGKPGKAQRSGTPGKPASPGKTTTVINNYINAPVGQMIGNAEKINKD